MCLADLTSLKLGGPAGRLVTARTEAELIGEVRRADAAREDVLILAGGSNVVVADDGWPGLVILVATRGVEPVGSRLRVQAGEPWDRLVESTVADGLAGFECLSGIPGSVGATPIQNVGAYGQEVSDTIVTVRAYDRRSGEVAELAADACAFTYRSSRFKREPGRWLVLRVDFELQPGGRSRPVRYSELARRLGVGIGDRAEVGEVRDAVLELRRAKGMVIDPGDPDSVSVGSFFTNPILSREEFERLDARVAPGAGLPRFDQPDGRVKTSAAWLVERAGFARGHGLPGPVAVSTKHSLALTNRGSGTTAELVALAHEVASGVERRFGVELVPEPVFVGHEWDGVTRG